jgi:hypothetical protein
MSRGGPPSEFIGNSSIELAHPVGADIPRAKRRGGVGMTSGGAEDASYAEGDCRRFVQEVPEEPEKKDDRRSEGDDQGNGGKTN